MGLGLSISHLEGVVELGGFVKADWLGLRPVAPVMCELEPDGIKHRGPAVEHRLTFGPLSDCRKKRFARLGTAQDFHCHANILPLAVVEQCAMGLPFDHCGPDSVGPALGGFSGRVIQQAALAGGLVRQQPARLARLLGFCGS